MRIRRFVESDREAVIALWHRCDLIRPQNDPDLDIDCKLQRDPDHFLVGELDGQLVATVMFGYDGHRGSVNYLAVSAEFSRRGYGSLLMDEAERQLGALGCPKVNLQVRTTNAHVADFYEKRGYLSDDVISLGKRLGQTLHLVEPPSREADHCKQAI